MYEFIESALIGKSMASQLLHIELHRVERVIVSHKNGAVLITKLLRHFGDALSYPIHPITSRVFCRFGDNELSDLNVHEYKCGVSLKPSRRDDFLVEKIK